jgi:hypothetical protein
MTRTLNWPRTALSLALISATLAVAVLLGSSSTALAARDSGYANLAAYCEANYPPGYDIAVWWGSTPALYCTDNISEPTHSYGPFTAAEACAFSGLGAPDPADYDANWPIPNFSPGFHCGPFDETPPTIAISAPGDGATYEQGQAVTAQYTCTDAESTVTGCSGTVPSGSALYTASPGTYAFTVNAGDSEGNEATQTVHYTVVGDHVTVALEPTGAPGSGSSVVTATITDTGPNGAPAVGKEVQIEPPPEYQVPALVCDSSNRLVYPSRLNSGELLGSSFRRITDGQGQIKLTLYVGTVAGDWTLWAGEPTEQREHWGSASLDVAQSGTATQLVSELPALLVAASDKSLVDFSHPATDDVLNWLGTLAHGGGVLSGVAFMPIHATALSGSAAAGVLLYANGPQVRSNVLSYLEGKSATVPPEGEAIVIDIASMREFQFGTTLAGHPSDSVGNRLPSLAEWEYGGRLDVGENSQGKPRYLPLTAHGRASAGFIAPTGAEDLLFGYGPYPPFAGSAQETAAFATCTGYTATPGPSPSSSSPSSASGADSGEEGTTLTVHSPINLIVRAANGTEAGVTATGQLRDTIPGASISRSGSHVHSVYVPNGSYTVQVLGTGSGAAHLVVTTRSASATGTRVFAFKARRGRSGSLSLSPSGAAARMSFAGRSVHGASGLKLSVRGLPRSLRRGSAVRLSLRVLDQFASPASGVEVRVTVPGGEKASAVSDSRGRVALTLTPRRAGRATVVLSGAGYSTRRLLLAVR